MSDSRKQVGSGEGSNPGEVSPESLGLHRFAVFTAAATFALIFIGGLVTSTGSALAVPDWPLSFGKFFPKMEGGVLYEHGHRMVAGAVAIMTLVLMVWILVRERRAWVRYIAVGAFGLVVVQAVLGGLTVLFLLPLPMAVAHAGTAQAFFCLTVALSLFTNPRWDVRSSSPTRRAIRAVDACACRDHDSGYLRADFDRRGDASHGRWPGDSRLPAFDGTDSAAA